MRPERWFSTLSAIAAVLAPRAQAQVIELAPFGGTTQFLADDPSRMVVDLDDSEAHLVVEEGKLDDPLHLGLDAALRLGEKWAIEGMFSWAPSTLSAVNLEDDVDVDLLRYSFGARFDAPEWNRARLFLGLGTGWETFDYALESADPDVHFAANALGGIAVRLAGDLRLRLDAREWFSRLNGSDEMSAEWESDLMLSTGLSWGLPLGR
jgi:hypothetical protein